MTEAKTEAVPSHNENSLSMSRRGLALTPLGAAIGVGLAATSAEAGLFKKKGRKPSAETRMDIMELFARYSWNYDCANPDGAAACFTEDAVLYAFGDEAARGRDGIVALIKDIHSNVKGDKVWQHWNSHFVFDGDDGACTVYCYTAILEKDGDTQDYGLRSYGFYRSECVKVEDEWLIAKRSINRWDQEQLPWADEAE